MRPRRASTAPRGFGDRVFHLLLWICAAAVPALLLAIVLELATSAWPSIGRFGWSFLTSTVWDPVSETYGALPMIVGTVISSLVALALAVPLALGVAIFLTEFAPGWMREPVARMVELLAAIPSVVYGLWGIFVLIPFLREYAVPFLQRLLGWTPFFSGTSYGSSMLAAALILAIMILPYISAVAREVLLSVPGDQREAALALGATRWEAVWTAVLPYGKTGLLGAVVLGLGRALGETMAVTMVIGNRHEISLSLLQPGYTMAAAIANEFAEAVTELHLAALFEIGLILFVVTVTVNAVARLLVWRVARGSAAGSRAF